MKDNLARKSVEFRTKMRCYKELKELYGMSIGRPKEIPSIDGIKLSQDEIAKEVCFLS